MRKLISMITGPTALTSWVLTSVAATYVGPFGTYSYLSIIDRAQYWFVIIGVSIVLALSIRVLAEEFLGRLAQVPQSAIVIALFTLSYASVLYGINLWVFRGVWDQVPSFGELMFFIALISIGIEALRYFLLKEIQPTPVESVADEPTQPAFLARLKPGIGSSLVRLKVRDHYVEAHTDSGSDLVLIRFSDAIRELEGIDGLQVHRSHWVARDAIAGHRKEKGKLILEMTDGAEVPVSRNYREAVSQAGII